MVTLTVCLHHGISISLVSILKGAHFRLDLHVDIRFYFYLFQHATLLLDQSLERGKWDLARDLVRFLKAIGNFGHIKFSLN